jgi:hypothetical protein
MWSTGMSVKKFCNVVHATSKRDPHSTIVRLSFLKRGHSVWRCSIFTIALFVAPFAIVEIQKHQPTQHTRYGHNS